VTGFSPGSGGPGPDNSFVDFARFVSIFAPMTRAKARRPTVPMPNNGGTKRTGRPNSSPPGTEQHSPRCAADHRVGCEVLTLYLPSLSRTSRQNRVRLDDFQVLRQALHILLGQKRAVVSSGGRGRLGDQVRHEVLTR